ncbi:MAG: hypothetical protein KGQ41_09790 [Alphaproteobacteria bacterium]|nr:hypothetical protein [Alphaproteobacteria bacterium]
MMVDRNEIKEILQEIWYGVVHGYSKSEHDAHARAKMSAVEDDRAENGQAFRDAEASLNDPEAIAARNHTARLARGRGVEAKAKAGAASSARLNPLA